MLDVEGIDNIQISQQSYDVHAAIEILARFQCVLIFKCELMQFERGLIQFYICISISMNVSYQTWNDRHFNSAQQFDTRSAAYNMICAFIMNAVNLYSLCDFPSSNVLASHSCTMCHQKSTAFKHFWHVVQWKAMANRDFLTWYYRK